MKTLFALAALAMICGAPPASAQAIESDRVTLSITHADLDLATAAGRSRVDRRIGLAVEKACGYASSADLAGQDDVRRCRVAATDRAAVQRDGAIARRSGTELASGR